MTDKLVTHPNGCSHGKTWEEPCIECKKIWYRGILENSLSSQKEALQKLIKLEKGTYVS